MTLKFDALEPIYEALALQLDAIAPARREIYLSKLVLMLAQGADDGQRVLQAIEACAADLDP